VPIGVVDRPFEQSRELLSPTCRQAEDTSGWWAPHSRASRPCCAPWCCRWPYTHTPLEVQFYGLDLAGGGIVATAACTCRVDRTRLERDRVLRTVEELAQLVEWREQMFHRPGMDSIVAYRALRARPDRCRPVQRPVWRRVLVVDGWGTLAQRFPGSGAANNRVGRPRPRLRGARGGRREPLVGDPPSMRDLLGTKLELRLGDPMESELGRGWPRACRTRSAVA